MTATSAYRRRLVVVAAVIPAALTVTACVVALTWLPRLPSEVAVHWSAAGADGFASPLLVPAALGVIQVLFAAIVLTALWRPGDGSRGNGRFLIAVGGWLPAFLAIALVGSLAPQLDSTDPASAPFPGLALLVGAACGAIVGAALWRLAPLAPPLGRTPDEPEPLDLPDDARVVLLDTASAPKPLLLVLGVAAAVLLVLGIAITVDAGPVGLVILVAPLLLTVTCLTLSWRIRIDSEAFVARPAIGLPVVRIPLAHLRDASVVEVSPVTDFGGWGLRHSSYGTGVILRTGAALRLEQTGGSFTITLDDAPRAAGLVRALLARRRTTA